MKTLKEIRLSLGLTQDVIARMLDVTRAHYAMVETGKRRCPYLWYEIIENIRRRADHIRTYNSGSSEVEETLQTKKVYSDVTRLNNKCKIQIILKSFQLEKMRSAYPKLKLAFDLVSKEISTFHFLERIVKPLNERKKYLAKAMRASTPFRQKLLEMQIDLLTQQVASYELLLTERKSTM